MKRFYLFLMIFFLVGCNNSEKIKIRVCNRLDMQAAVDIFPKTVTEITALKNQAITVIDNMLKDLEEIQLSDQPTFHNSIRIYDNAKLKYQTNLQILSTLSLLDRSSAIRSAANSAVFQLQKYEADSIARNPILFQTFQNYLEKGNDDRYSTNVVQSFLHKTLDNLKRQGAHLSSEEIIKLNQLEKEIKSLEAQFRGNIFYSYNSIEFTKEDLSGVSDAFIKTLVEKNGKYIVPVNYDSFFAISENCSIEATRKKFFFAFGRRAYPQNISVLKQLMNKRNEFARLVGFKDFAEYECSSQMIQTPQKAETFLWSIVSQTNKMVQKEFDLMIKDLPASVVLTDEGKLKPWDESFVKSYYRKKHFDVDMAVVSQYFVLDDVLEEIRRLLENFFSISLETMPTEKLWSSDLSCWRVRLLSNNAILGYLVLDLYARDGKSDQPCHVVGIPSIKDDCSLFCSGLSTVITNFENKSDQRQNLLELHDVRMLLHELGHGLHEIFGATEFVDFTGTKVMGDFLEAPSQLFEMWIDCPKILKKLSKHYLSGKSLPDDLIEKIIASEKFGKASRLQRQCLLSLISLEFGKINQDKDVHAVVAELYKKVRIDVAYDTHYYFEAAFEHLANYGAHYYGYVWSKALAAAMFQYIQTHGIMNPQVGKKLRHNILRHGGAVDPNILIKKFLSQSIDENILLKNL